MKKTKCSLKLFGTTTVWPKWQLVIPKELRDKLSINAWDSMTIILKDYKFIWILKNNDLWELLEYAKNEWVQIN